MKKLKFILMVLTLLLPILSIGQNEHLKNISPEYTKEGKIELKSILNDSTKQDTLDVRSFYNINHYCIVELGARQTDYSKFNSLLESNNFPTLSSPNFYAEIGYLGEFKKLNWSLKVSVYSSQNEKSNNNQINGSHLGLEGGLGYTLIRNRYIRMISYFDYGFVSFKYSLSNKNTFNFDNIQGIKKLKLSQANHYISPGIGFYYCIVPPYNFIGMRFNYNVGIGNGNYNDELTLLNRNADIKVNGLEIMLSIIIKFD